MNEVGWPKTLDSGTILGIEKKKKSFSLGSFSFSVSQWLTDCCLKHCAPIGCVTWFSWEGLGTPGPRQWQQPQHELQFGVNQKVSASQLSSQLPDVSAATQDELGKPTSACGCKELPKYRELARMGTHTMLEAFRCGVATLQSFFTILQSWAFVYPLALCISVEILVCLFNCNYFIYLSIYFLLELMWWHW